MSDNTISALVTYDDGAEFEGHNYNTLGWVSDNQAVIEATEAQLGYDDNILTYSTVEECEEQEGAIEVTGSHETYWVKEA